MIKKLYKRFDSWMDYDPPGALSAKGWRLFNKEFQEKAPIRYWVRNTFRETVIYPLSRNHRKIYDFISYRFFDRSNIVNTGLKPGYYDIDTRILHVNFNMLKDFVECELAWTRQDYDEKDPWYKRLRIARMYQRSVFRNPKLGIEYMEWAATLDDPSLPPYERCEHQAVAAREMHTLYDWWVNKRPNRKEIEIPEYSNQGLDMFSCIDEDFDKNAEDYKKSKAARDEQAKQSDVWQKEDDEMLIRLVKLRHSIWI